MICLQFGFNYFFLQQEHMAAHRGRSPRRFLYPDRGWHLVVAHCLLPPPWKWEQGCLPSFCDFLGIHTAEGGTGSGETPLCVLVPVGHLWSSSGVRQLRWTPFRGAVVWLACLLLSSLPPIWSSLSLKRSEAGGIRFLSHSLLGVYPLVSWSADWNFAFSVT